jgi:hypothetical protein
LSFLCLQEFIVFPHCKAKVEMRKLLVPIAALLLTVLLGQVSATYDCGRKCRSLMHA